MKIKLTEQDITPDLLAAGYLVLSMTVRAKAMRAEVDIVQYEVIKGFDFRDDLVARHIGRDPEPITRPQDLYLSEDEEAVARYYVAVDLALRKAGLKPETMDQDHCPALVAEYAQLEAEWALLDVVANIMQLGFNGAELNNRLLSLHDGLEQRRRFIDLLLSLVVVHRFTPRTEK